MKKILCLLILVSVLAALVSCGGGIPAGTDGTAQLPESAPGTENASETAPSAKTDEEKTPYPVISDRSWAEKLAAIPVANASMSEDELRRICVDYMLLQAKVVWTPDENMTYECTYSATADSSGNLNLRRGVRYGGLNYSSAARDLASLLDFYDPETGVLSVSQFGTGCGTIFGNNCGTACFWGWARVSSTITYSGTRTMTFSRGCIPLGNYTYDLSLPNFDVTTTGAICEANGQQKMFESYALLKPASGLAMYNAGITGHARMVQEKAVVVRDASGRINGSESYVICVEQDSVQERVESADGAVMNIGNVGKKYTFQNLFNTGYLPFEIPEFCGRAKVQKAAAELRYEGEATFANLASGTIGSNYCISRADLTIRDAEGKTVYTNYALGSSNGTDQYTMAANRLIRTAALTRNLKKGQTYSVSVTARLGSGETLEVFSGSAIYS